MPTGDKITELPAGTIVGGELVPMVQGGVTKKGALGSMAAATATDYVLLTVLASTANGNGASLVGIEDAGAYFASDDVEGALQEVGADLDLILGDYLTSADIGVTVEAWSANLDDWSAVNPSDYYTAAQVDAGFQPLDADLTALAAISTGGLLAHTGAGTAAARTLTGPAAGITVSNGDGVSGNPTLALANDLAALEALAGTGFAVRTATDTWAQRSIDAGNAISISNGDGVAANPTITGAAGRRSIADITGGDTIVATDRNKLVNIASGTGTLAFTAAATLGSTFWCVIKNSGTGDVTLDPSGAELIDGLANWKLYPGGTIQLYCDGSALFTVLLTPMRKQFDSSDTFTTPGSCTFVQIEAWGGGASGAGGTTSAAGGGGGGAAYNMRQFPRSVLGATETVTIGAGGATVTGTSTNGNPGGNTTFGALLTAFGGGGGSGAASGTGGGGGGQISAGATATGIAGAPLTDAVSSLSAQGSGGSVGTVGRSGMWGGGGGGGGDSGAAGGNGGDSVYGGAGGGGGGDTTAGGNGGASSFGGNGGAGATGAAAASPGVQPGGGGGGSENAGSGSGAGGDGRVVVRMF